MADQKKYQDLIKKTQFLISHKNKNSGLVIVLNQIENILAELFDYQNDDEFFYSENDFDNILEGLGTIAYSISLLNRKRKLNIKMIKELVRKTIDSLLCYKEEFVEGFQVILSNLISSASLLDTFTYNQFISSLLEVVQTCIPSSSKFTSIELLTSNSLKVLESECSDSFFRSNLFSCILLSIFQSRAKFSNNESLKQIETLWIYSKMFLNQEEKIKHSVAQACFYCSLEVLKSKRKNCSPSDQLYFIEDIVKVIHQNITNNNIFDECEEPLNQIFKEIEHFIMENSKLLIFKKEMREIVLNVLNIWLKITRKFEFIKEYVEFSTWMVNFSSSFDHPPDIPRQISYSSIQILINRIKRIVKNIGKLQKNDKMLTILPNFLDILHSFFQLNRIENDDIFRFIEAEFIELNAFENPNWPFILSSILSVQHPWCQTFVKRFAPSVDNLWMRMKQGDCRKTINKYVFIIGLCPFLNYDDGGKQIISFLLIPCLNNLRAKFGNKWDNFRVYIGNNQKTTSNSTSPITDLDQFVENIIPDDDEKSKIDALVFALLINRKSNQIVQLIADMTISVITKLKSRQIMNVLPALINFIEENYIYGLEIINSLVEFLSKNYTEICKNDMEIMCETLRKLISFTVNKGIERQNETNFYKKNQVMLKIDEKSFEKLIKIFFENRKKYSENTIKYFLQFCHTILISAELKKSSNTFAPFFHSFDILFTNNLDNFITCWEIIDETSIENIEKKVRIYLPSLNSTLAKNNKNIDAFKINKLLNRLTESNLNPLVQVLVLSSIFVHSSIVDNESVWNSISINLYNFTRQIIEKNEYETESEVLQALIKRFHSYFSRSFITRFLVDRKIFGINELKLREIIRVFIVRLKTCFKYSNISKVVLLFKPNLLYWSIIGGSKVQNCRMFCTIIDFLCQEFIIESSTNSQLKLTINNYGMDQIIDKRKLLISEAFIYLLQKWKSGICRNNEAFWKFCERRCGFLESDLTTFLTTFRKDVFQNLIMVVAEEFLDLGVINNNIINILKKSYESLHRGRKFSISSAMEYKNEGIDILLLFRKYFTSDNFYSIRQKTIKSFRIVVQSLSKQFFDENWWTIQLVLRNCPNDFDDTITTWVNFIDRLDYTILRTNIWRIISDISQIINNETIIDKIWERLNSSNRNDTFKKDLTLHNFLWIKPQTNDDQLVKSINYEKYQRIEQVFPIIRNFKKFPTTLFVPNILIKIKKNSIWKDDLPVLLSELVEVITKCENQNDRDQILDVFKVVPFVNSDLADRHFSRKDMCFDFFLNLSERTQVLLDECIQFVEKRSCFKKLEYVDRTLCEVFKFLSENNSDLNRKLMIEGVKIAYARMACTVKPEPDFIELNNSNQCSPMKSTSFCNWLTKLICTCISDKDAQFTSFISISHIGDINFLTHLFSRFLLFSIVSERDCVVQKILNEFENVLNTQEVRITKSERYPVAFIFYIFDFLYFYMNNDQVNKDKNTKSLILSFWLKMIECCAKDEHGHEIPILVKVAERFGMEKRCIQWLEIAIEIKLRNEKVIDKHFETSYYYTLMKLYARIYELNGVRGAYNRLSKIQVDHLYAKICIREAYGNVSDASLFYQMIDENKKNEPVNIVQKAYDDFISSIEMKELETNEKEEYEEFEMSMKHLIKWVEIEKDFGESPLVFNRNIESRAIEAKIIDMINKDECNDRIINSIKNAKNNIFEKLGEWSIGGSCSYETALPFLVQLQMYDEIETLRNAPEKDLIDDESILWKNLTERTIKSEQKLNILEPILRARRLILEKRMSSMVDKDKEKIRSKIVETHLHCARIARLHGCQERSLLSIINAKKVMPFDNKIVLEEAKLQIQTCDEKSGMNLLNSILSTTFGELTKHFGDTQSSDLDLKSTAKLKIDNFPKEEKHLYSSVQVLRISHMIKSGNTIGFEKIYEETTNLLNAFVSSGVMYEAAWLLDYLFHFNERNKTVLPLLKAYREVAKYEKNSVLQARAIERMTSLWLGNTRKLKGAIDDSKLANSSDLIMQMKVMNTEMKDALKEIGWKAFYPAYAILARQIDHKDKEVFMTIKQMMIQLIIRLPHQCMWQSVYILRSLDSEKIERYKEVLNHVKRKDPYYATIIDQYDYASLVFKTVPERVREESNNLTSLMPQMKILFKDKKYDSKSLEFDRRASSQDTFVVCGIMVPIRSDIDESVQGAKEMLENNYSEACTIDDRYLILDYDENVKVLKSMTTPVIIKLMTASGRKLQLICKKDDDLTKDYHFTKIVEMCNDLLTKDEQTRILNMHATTYSVIPLAKTGGVIEFMEGVTPYFEAVDSLADLKSRNEKHNQWMRSMRQLTKEKKVEFFRDVCCKETPLVMAKWFRKQYPEAGKWFVSRKLFAKSAAVMSIIGYIFGLGDRHTKNLMIHIPTGKCVHVDFDMIFNKGDGLDVPEVVPFRLTRNMINGMGEIALEGEFRTVCEQTLRVFRENSYEIEKFIADLPDLVEKKTVQGYDMKEAKRLVSGRLRGQIVTAKIYRSNPISHPMKVVQLASSLIELATSDEKLAEMFFGWMPFV